MGRIFTVLFAVAFALGAVFGLSVLAYEAGHLANEHAFQGADRITNMVFLMLLFVMVIATLLTIAERKWSALIQDRIGPNRARIDLPGLRQRALGGLPHIIADSLKMLTKEAFRPAAANRLLFELGPILSFAPVFALFAIVPVGPTVTWDKQTVSMVVATPDFGLLFVFAIASLAVYGTSLAGWSSNNKLALLGGVRASSQMISYEVALGLSLVGMMLVTSSVQLPEITDTQRYYLWRTGTAFDLGLPRWGIFLQPVGFLGFFAAAFAETKRAPFDLPEGESEIIGYFVEYSGMKFGMFMIAEFVEIVVLSAITASVFFGGYHLPFGEEWLGKALGADAHALLWGALLATVFWVKVLFLCWLQLAIRWTFPRFRYDQVQRLGWKMLLPIGLVNVFVSAGLFLWDPTLHALAVLGLIEIGALLALTFGGVRKAAPGLEPPRALAAHPH